MKNIFKIYYLDIKNIITNWVLLVVVLGLIILPSLYAWFNIKSSWDPYGKTSGISIAVVNKDKGATFKEKSIDIGKELVNNLKTNKKIGWKFVDYNEAQEGVKYGRYYASIVVPEDFSEKILTIVEDNPEKPDLIYSVNEKINAIAPKITDKGITNVQAELTKTFVETVNGIIFNLFNKLGIEIEKSKPKLKDMMNIIFYIDKKSPEINKAIDKVQKGALTLREFIDEINVNMPSIEDVLEISNDISVKSKSFLQKSKDTFKKVSPFIKDDLIVIKDVLSTSKKILPGTIDYITNNKSNIKEKLIKVKGNLNFVVDKIEDIEKILTSMNKRENNYIINKFKGDISLTQDKIKYKITIIDKTIQIINKGENPSLDLLKRLDSESDEINDLLDKSIKNYDSKIVPSINKLADNLIKVADETAIITKEINKDLPEIKKIINTVKNDSIKGKKYMDTLKKKLPYIQLDIHKLSDKLKELNDDEKLNEMIELLKNNAKKESEFIANPINIKENRMFPIPNYGSAMAPFFTVLSLWVGALILVSLISVDVKDLENRFTYRQCYLGRYLTFMTIAVFQSLVVSLGDIYLLGVYNTNNLMFVLFSVFISIVFSMIVYTLVSIFGNIGKALSIILLVLQISASGGTFPIEVTPAFFQAINPFLPFTYAITCIREISGGIIWNILYYNFLILLIYFILFFIMGILFKENVNKIREKFIHKLREGNLIEH